MAAPRSSPLLLAALVALSAAACKTAPKPAQKVGSARGQAVALSLSPDGRLLALASLEDPIHARVEVWDLAEGRPRWSAAVPEGDLPSVLLFPASGGLLVGLRRPSSRETWHAFWTLGADGHPVGRCAAPSPHQPGPRWGQVRGVESIAELSDGRVATGGADDSLAIWNTDSCSVEWPKGEACCVADSTVRVAAAPGGGLFTVGEVRWIDEEKGSEPLGPRRWQGPPWRVEPVSPGTSSWTALAGAPSSGGAAPSAVASDGSCEVVRQDPRVVVRLPSGQALATQIPEGRASFVAVSAGCDVVAAVLDDGIFLCRKGECFAR